MFKIYHKLLKGFSFIRNSLRKCLFNPLDSLFLLNPTGVFVWEQMDGRRTVQELSQAVAKTFGVEETIATADAKSFLASLRERNLVEGITADGH